MHTKEELKATRDFIGFYITELLESTPYIKSYTDTTSVITLQLPDGSYQLFPFDKPIASPEFVSVNEIVKYLNDQKLVEMLNIYCDMCKNEITE